jgi:23S rRNA (guanosine2251-2'-O)-methyltransferase
MRRHSSRSLRTSRAPLSDVLFGIHPVRELLSSSPASVERVYVAPAVQAAERVADEARAHRIAVEVVDRSALDDMTAGGHHQGLAARIRPATFVPFEDLLQVAPRLLVVLDGITDPQNLGAILRSAEVLGGGGAIVPKHGSAGLTPAVVRASSGAALHLPVCEVVNLVRSLERLKEQGYWIVGLDGAGPSRFQELPSLGRAVLLVGGEGKGIRPLVSRACDFLVGIPVRGRVGSLNAAAAAAIGLHELATRLPPDRVEPGDC